MSEMQSKKVKIMAKKKISSSAVGQRYRYFDLIRLNDSVIRALQHEQLRNKEYDQAVDRKGASKKALVAFTYYLFQLEELCSSKSPKELNQIVHKILIILEYHSMLSSLNAQNDEDFLLNEIDLTLFKVFNNPEFHNELLYFVKMLSDRHAKMSFAPPPPPRPKEVKTKEKEKENNTSSKNIYIGSAD